MKLCKICQTEKSSDEFHRNKNARDGLMTICKLCNCAKSKRWVRDNSERHARSCKSYRDKNKDACVARAQSWAENNRERSREIKAAWKKRNKETTRRHAREGYARNNAVILERKRIARSINRTYDREYLRKRRQSNPMQQLRDNVGNALRSALKANKGGRKWEEIVGYNSEVLKLWLESKFQPGMSWDNYGEWHIDHKRPVSWFDFSVKPLEVARECWALENLQPLWAIENHRKGNRYETC